MKLSTCCGAEPLGCIDYGVCSDCRDACDFEEECEENEEEAIDPWVLENLE